MSFYLQLFVSVFSVLIATAALLSSRRQSRMNALMLYNEGWTTFNRELATNLDLQAAFASLDGYENTFSPKTRAFLYYITLAENAFHLRKEGLISKDDYFRFMRLTGGFVRASKDFDFKFMGEIGFNQSFIEVLEKESQ